MQQLAGCLGFSCWCRPWNWMEHFDFKCNIDRTFRDDKGYWFFSLT